MWYSWYFRPIRENFRKKDFDKFQHHGSGFQDFEFFFTDWSISIRLYGYLPLWSQLSVARDTNCRIIEKNSWVFISFYVKIKFKVKIGLTENFEKIRKKSKKKIFLRKNQEFSQLHDAVFHFLAAPRWWYPGVLQI